jgi:hypothetical protein
MKKFRSHLDDKVNDKLICLFMSVPENFKITPSNVKLWNSQGIFPLDGMIAANKIKLDGRLVISKVGEYYTGQVDGEGRKKGVGRFDCQSYLYEGQWMDNMWNGIGRLIYTDGEVLFGSFLNNVFHGFGKKTYPNGKVEEGYFSPTGLKGKDFDPNANGMQIKTSP